MSFDKTSNKIITTKSEKERNDKQILTESHFRGGGQWIRRKSIKFLFLFFAFCIWNPMQIFAAGQAPQALSWGDNDGAITLQAKDKKKLDVHVLPEGSDSVKLVWKSNNKKIASVNKNGVVTAKKKGTAKITCYIKSKPKTKITCKVKVKAAPEVQLSWINSDTQRNAAVKQTIKLKANVKNSKLKWSSSNKKVATVSSSGKVTFKKTGKVTITCKKKNKSSNKVKCKFVVKKRASKLYLSDTGKQLLHVGESCRRTTGVSGANAFGDVIWSSSSGEVATVSPDGLVQAQGTGLATITATLQDGSNRKVSYQVKVIGSIYQGGTKFIAHSGFSSQAPENTVKAYELAGEAKFWGAEGDIQATKDGKFVVMHDDSLLRMCGVNQKLADMTYEQVRKAKIIRGANISKYSNDASATTVPSLEEYLKTCIKYNMVPVIEIKMAYNLMGDETTPLSVQTVDSVTGEVEKEEREPDINGWSSEQSDVEGQEDNGQEDVNGDENEESTNASPEPLENEHEINEWTERSEPEADEEVLKEETEEVLEENEEELKEDETDALEKSVGDIETEDKIASEVEKEIQKYPEVTMFEGQELQSVSGSTLERLYEETKQIMGNRSYIFIAFDYRNLLKMNSLKKRDKANNIILQHLGYDTSPSQLADYQQAGIGLDIFYSFLDPSQISGIVGQGIPLGIWTVDDEEKTWDYVNAGIPYITTNVKLWK